VALRVRSLVTLFGTPVDELIRLHRAAVGAAEQPAHPDHAPGQPTTPGAPPTPPSPGASAPAPAPARTAAVGGGNPFDPPHAGAAGLNPFGDAPPTAAPSNPFDDPPHHQQPAHAPAEQPTAACSSNPFDAAGPPSGGGPPPSGASADSVPLSPSVGPHVDDEILPERSPTDLLRVLMRRAEPSAFEFVRSLREAEQAEMMNKPSRRPSVANALLPIGAPAAGKRESFLRSGTLSELKSRAGGLTSMIKGRQKPTKK
jgi:hypothetical protein